MDKLLTIVVPTYNMQDYLHQCLNSLIVSSELMDQLEVLVINDGSTDNSSAIAHEYEAKYPETFKAIDKENGGHGSCCDLGLYDARGKYYKVLDADDWLVNLECFLSTLKETKADIVFTQCIRSYHDSGKNELVPCVVPASENEHLLDELTVQDVEAEPMFCNLWYATYRTALLKPFYPLFSREKIYTDVILFAAPFMLSETYLSLDLPLYTYRLNRPGQSVDKSVENKNRDVIVKTLSHMLSFVMVHYDSMGSSNRREVVDFIVSKKKGYWITSMAGVLPYRVCKRQMAFMRDKVLRFCPVNLQSSNGKLYLSTPFFVYWNIARCYKYIQTFLHKIAK